MSDSGISDERSAKLPPDRELERSLRKQVATEMKHGNTAEMTVNSLRKAVEQELGLKLGFFANHPRWKGESKRIIRDEIDKPEPITASPKPVARPKKPIAIAKTAPTTKLPKRPSTRDEEPSRKRQKKASVVLEDSDLLSSSSSETGASEEKHKAVAKRAKVQAKKPVAPQNNQSKKRTIARPRKVISDDESSESAVQPIRSESPEEPAAEDSGSEMSIVLDEEPKPKTKRKPKDSSASTSKKPVEQPKAAKSKKEESGDPGAAEIKELQGWLVKCGIRKLWGKELKPYDGPKEKIQHLRQMLTDVGMTGRYSTEKAFQIKEARELAADLEAVQEGAEMWGTKGTEEGRRSRLNRRVAVRANQTFSDSASEGGSASDVDPAIDGDSASNGGSTSESDSMSDGDEETD